MQLSDKIGGYLLLKEIDVKKANALSGHLVYGFPAITAFKGLVHAISRKLARQSQFNGVSLRGVMIACHEYNVQGMLDSNKLMRFSQSSFPATTYRTVHVLTAQQRLPSIVEQAYINIKTSLVIEVVVSSDITDSQKQQLVTQVFDFIRKNKVAGGVVTPDFSQEQVHFIDCDDLDDIAYEIPSSYLLMDAEHLMQEYLSEHPDEDALDALIKLSSLRIDFTKDTIGLNQAVTRYQPWPQKYAQVVPITTGFQGVSDALSSYSFDGSLANDEIGVETQYVEAVYSLGRWESPHVLRLSNRLKDAFWYYHYDKEKSLYTASQNKKFTNGDQ